ncbi:MAG: hypothetical protein MZV65_34405 [Chromatiales bacterium]|nr:hypothetical protein [Chromatiales bacterium]
MLQALDAHWQRPPGGHGPPAPGHPPARLRAEEPEGGVQARGVPAVLGRCSTASSRRGDRRHHPCADPRRAGCRGPGGAAPGAQQCPL